MVHNRMETYAINCHDKHTSQTPPKCLEYHKQLCRVKASLVQLKNAKDRITDPKLSLRS
jgi:hypothetical protein